MFAGRYEFATDVCRTSFLFSANSCGLNSCSIVASSCVSGTILASRVICDLQSKRFAHLSGGFLDAKVEQSALGLGHAFLDVGVGELPKLLGGRHGRHLPDTYAWCRT